MTVPRVCFHKIKPSRITPSQKTDANSRSFSSLPGGMTGRVDRAYAPTPTVARFGAGLMELTERNPRGDVQGPADARCGVEVWEPLASLDHRKARYRQLCYLG